jgi:hypothetical protein
MGILGNLTGSELSDKYVSEEQKRKNEGLLEMLKNMPEETWDRMHWLDKAALMSSPIPVIGTGVGLAADIRSAVQEPEEFFTPANLAMTGVGYVPFGRLGKYGEQLGIWGGGTAKNAPEEDMFQAKQMAKEGEKPSNIYDKTKIRVDDAGAASFEIPDYPSKLTKDLSQYQEGNIAGLMDVLQHPELYRNYPSMSDMEVRFHNDPSRGATGWYDPSEDTVNFNLANMGDVDSQRSALLHELQHAVQQREGTSIGGNLRVGEELYKVGKSAQNKINEQISNVTDKKASLMQSMDVENSRALYSTSAKMDEIDRLRGYLEDYYKGGNLTDKRRHIFNSGASIMDHNAEYRMRNDISWAKKHRPKSERNANYEEYIQRAIKAGEESLDPKLVKQVKASGVKNPTKKYEREIGKFRTASQPLDSQLYAVKNAKELLDPMIDIPYFSRLPSDATQLDMARANAGRNYENLAGEVEARLVQERRNTPPSELGNPFRGNVYSEYPSEGQVYIRPDASIDAESTLGSILYDDWEKLYKKLGFK